MYDYINRDAVFDWFCESADIDGCVDLPKNNGSCKKGCRHCIDGKELDEIPTADVRENVHGRWIKDGIPGLLCSNCGKHIIVERQYISFCPNCGAVMTIDKSFEDWIKKEG